MTAGRLVGHGKGRVVLPEPGAQGHWEEPGATQGLSGGSCSHVDACSLPETIAQAERGEKRPGFPLPVPSRFLQVPLVS